ncbi:hypothetical protein, partial [Okeania sp. SIO2B9]
MESLFALCRRQPVPPPRRGRQETGEMGMSQEVGARIVSQFFCHNHPKIPACMSFFHQKVGTFFNAKTLKPLS